MKKIRLAELMSVDPRTVARWESAETVPSAVIPGLRKHLPLPLDTDGDELSTTESDPPATDDVTDALRHATPEQLLREVAARMSGHRPTPADPPPAPTARYRLRKNQAPSRRLDPEQEQRKPGRQGQ